MTAKAIEEAQERCGGCWCFSSMEIGNHHNDKLSNFGLQFLIWMLLASISTISMVASKLFGEPLRRSRGPSRKSQLRKLSIRRSFNFLARLLFEQLKTLEIKTRIALDCREAHLLSEMMARKALWRKKRVQTAEKRVISTYWRQAEKGAKEISRNFTPIRRKK